MARLVRDAGREESGAHAHRPPARRRVLLPPAADGALRGRGATQRRVVDVAPQEASVDDRVVHDSAQQPGCKEVPPLRPELGQAGGPKRVAEVGGEGHAQKAGSGRAQDVHHRPKKTVQAQGVHDVARKRGGGVQLEKASGV